MTVKRLFSGDKGYTYPEWQRRFMWLWLALFALAMAASTQMPRIVHAVMVTIGLRH